MASESTAPTVALSPFGDNPCSGVYPGTWSFQELEETWSFQETREEDE
jgi:hypothetical protein